MYVLLYIFYLIITLKNLGRNPYELGFCPLVCQLDRIRHCVLAGCSVTSFKYKLVKLKGFVYMHHATSLIVWQRSVASPRTCPTTSHCRDEHAAVGVCEHSRAVSVPVT